LQTIAESVSAQDKWTLLLWSDNKGLQSLFQRLPSPSVLFEAIIGNEGELVVPVLFGVVQGVGGVIAAIAIILVLSVYWSISQNHFERLWLSLLPTDQRKRVRSIWQTIEHVIGAYVRGQVLHSILVGTALGLGYWLIGSSSPALLALVAIIGSMIPVVGLFLVVFTTLMLGLLTSVQISLFTVLYTIVILTALGIWVKPRLINRQWDNPILTMVSLTSMDSVIHPPSTRTLKQVLLHQSNSLSAQHCSLLMASVAPPFHRPLLSISACVLSGQREGLQNLF